MSMLRLTWLLALIGCRAEFTTPQQGWMDVPNNVEPATWLTQPIHQRFGSGQIMVWNPEAAPELVSEIIKNADQRQNIQIEYLRLVAEDLMEPFGWDWLRELDSLEKLQKVRAQEAGVGIEQGMSRWFDQQMPSQVSSEQIKRANQMFAIYCEAKVWERALEPSLMDARYQRRPSPSRLCENHYQEEKLFEYGDAVLCGPEVAGRDYFACLWSQGILKTSIFRQYRYGNNSSVRQSLELIPAEVVQWNIAQDPSLKLRILTNKPFVLKSPDQGAAVLTVGVVGKPMMDEFEDDSVFSIIFNIESRKKRYFFVNEAGEAFHSLTQDLTAMLRFTTGISPHEEIFNAPFGISLRESQAKARVEEANNARERFKNYLVRSTSTLDEKIEQSEDSLKDLALNMDTTLKKVQDFDCSQPKVACPEREVIERNVELIRDESGGDLLFANGVLSITPNEEDELEVAFRFHSFEGPEFVMCVVRSTGSAVACKGQSESLMQAEMDPKSGSFQFKWRGLFKGRMNSMLVGRDEAKQIGQIDFSALAEDLEDSGCFAMTIWPDVWRSEAGTDLSSAFRGKLAIFDGECVGKPVRTGSVLLRQTQLEVLEGLDRLRQKRTAFLSK
jgi:hypothetical protein